VEVKPIENEMAFHQFFSGSSLDWNSILSPNIDSNYNHISSGNAAYSSIFSEPCHQLPYSNPPLLHNRFQSDAWTSVGTHETYVTTPLCSSNQFINNSLYDCYSVQRSLSLPDPAFRSFSQQLDREHLSGYSANLSQQYSDFHPLNSGSVIASYPQIQHYQHPAYLVQGTDNIGTNQYTAVPHHYSVDEIMQNTITSSAQLISEQRNVHGIQRSLPDGGNVQQMTFCNYSPSNQLHVLGQDFDDRTNMFPKSCITHSSAGDTSITSMAISTGSQSLTDISAALGSERKLRDCAVNGCMRNGCAGCMASYSCTLSSVSEANIDMVSSTGDDFLCTPMPEMPKSEEEPVTCVPSVNCSGKCSFGAESIHSSRISASPIQTDAGVSDIGAINSGSKAPVKEDEHIGMTDIELDTPCVTLNDIFTTSAPAVSAALQLLAESSKNSRVISAVNSAVPSEVNASDKQVTNRQEAVTAQPDAVNCQPVDAFSNSSDNLIVLSPFPIDSEPTAAISMNPGTTTVHSSPQMQSASTQPKADCHLLSGVYPIVPKSLPSGLPYVSSCSSHMISSLADITTSSYKKPMFRHPAVTVTCNSLGKGHQYATEMKRERVLHLTRTSVADKSLKLRMYNMTQSSNERCNELKNLQHSRLQKPVPAKSQVFSQRGITHHNACRNIDSILTSGVSHISSTVRTNLTQNHTTCYMPRFPLCRQGSSTFQLSDASVKKHGTYSIAAARAVLQRLKQTRLSDIISARAPRYQQLLKRKFSSVSQTGVSEAPDVIDLTDDTKDNAVETCENIFALTRRRMTSSNRFVQRPRQNFLGTSMSCVSDGSRADTRHQQGKKVFAVDRSLTFYRCFVQKLLRNFKFSPSGAPVAVYPAVPEMMPSAPPSTAGTARKRPSTDRISIYKELMQKGNPVVKLNKLDQSVLNNLKKYGSIKICTQHSSTCALPASPRIVLENCVPHVDASEKLRPYESHAYMSQSAVDSKFDWTKEEIDRKETMKTKAAAVECEFEHESNVHDSHNGIGIYHRQQIAEFDWTEEENNQKENAIIKITANRQQQYDDLVSLCRPVSVVLERLDNTKIYSSSTDLCETETCHQKQIAELETQLSVSNHNWTIFQIPRANKVPIIIIRSVPPSALKSCQNKVAKKTSKCRTHFLRKYTSKYLRTRNHSVGIGCGRKFAQRRSKLDIPQPKTGSRKLHSAHSLSMSLRSSRILQSCHILMPVTRMSSKYSKQHTKHSEQFMKRSGIGNSKYRSKLTDRLHKGEGLITSVDLSECSVFLDSTSVNDLPAILPYDSDNNMVEQAPHFPLNVTTSVDGGVCFAPSDSAQNNVLSGSVLTGSSFFHKHFSNDSLSLNSNAVISSSADLMNSVDQHMSVSLASKNALTSDLLTYRSVCSEDLQEQEDCVSSDSDTIVFSRHSSMDDVTIPYRSPLNDLFDSDEPTLDQQGQLDINLEAGVDDKKFHLETLHSNEELRPTLSDLGESCTFSELLDSSLITHYSMDSERLQPTPVRLIGPVDAKPETQHSVNNELSEFIDGDQMKHGIAGLISVEVVVENSNTGL